MNKAKALGLPMGLIVGVILGALFHNMAIGILVGLALGFGIIKFGGGKSANADAASPSDD